MEWLKISGCERYEINEEGVIISYVRGAPKQIKPRLGKDGYLKVNLMDNYSNRVTKDLHRLVAETFIPNPNNEPTVDHIDRQIQNNHVSNLRWVSRAEQQQNTGGMPHAKAVTLRNTQTGDVKTWQSTKGCARETGIDTATIRRLRNGTRKTAKGWEYVHN